MTFNAIAGWISLSPVTVNLVGGNTTIEATYTQTAALTVDVTPAGGQWRIDGGAWQPSGTTASDLVPGSHTLEYSALAGYTAPPAEMVALARGLTRSMAGLSAGSNNLRYGTTYDGAGGGPPSASGPTDTACGRIIAAPVRVVDKQLDRRFGDFVSRRDYPSTGCAGVFRVN